MKIFTPLSFICLLSVPLFSYAQEKDPYASIYDNVIQHNADNAVTSCLNLQTALSSKSDDVRHQAFVTLAKSWGKVQASYILGDYDMNAMDYPLMIDYFHSGNENIHESIERLVSRDSKPSTALYKNSYKTMGAIDSVMFSADWTERRKEFAKVMVANVCERFTQISDGYKANRDAFLFDVDRGLSLVVNAEIEHIYKTRDWRIAQVSGLTKANLGITKPELQQYPYSQASWAFIGGILETNEQLLGEKKQPNVATIAYEKHGKDGINAVQTALKASLLAYKNTPVDHNFKLNEMIPVYQGLLDVQKAFYRHLVSEIGVSANLIDADGD
ncbi:hypothetical protein E2R68_06625 [Psychromonas sp. RZ22]|uniref:imelysin family protein n=1 Tax=Psychromonas algarum TaxID=2555643 RepID=UPI001068280A|nr:imelysin family protein [Psychromonas sp. RZ22]TEW54842.1 hypothetical protein E2R68_06625 [Psychromonas sp. RZ22]